MQTPQASTLSGGRLHLHHGPIDLIIRVWGAGRQAAYQLGADRFQTILDELVTELPQLRRPASCNGTSLQGAVARHMYQAVRPHANVFVTPMAAVAGAVADTICTAMSEGGQIDRLYVNNGGDIAVFLTPGQCLDAAIHAENGAGKVHVAADQPARGVATSGWRGRSHSFGIADAVIVLARDAAAADVAATLIANAVDLPGHANIKRVPACTLSPDSDLLDRLVTVDVGGLSPQDVRCALSAGADCATTMHRGGLICGAALFLRNQTAVVGAMPAQNISDGEQHDRLQTA